MSQRDPDSVTGYKYDLNEKGPQDGWWNRIKHRYRKAEDRVTLAERTPEAKIRMAEESQLSDPNFRHGEFDPIAYQKNLDKKAEEFKGMIRGGMEIERDAYYNSPELAKKQAMRGITQDAGLNKIETDAYNQYKKGFENLSLDEKQKKLGIFDSVKPESKEVQNAVKAKDIIAPIVPKVDNVKIPEYDSFGDLMKQRDNAEKGTEIYKGLQSRVNELYGRGGGTYEGAKKAFDVGKDFSLREAAESTDAISSTMEAVDTGEEIASGVASTTAKSTAPVPGIGEALAAKSVYDAWTDDSLRGEEKIAKTAETGADLASSYAITSGNPYAMAAGGAYKVGKLAWDLLT